MNGKRAKYIRKLAKILANEYPEYSERRWYKQLKLQRKRDRMYAN